MSQFTMSGVCQLLESQFYLLLWLYYCCVLIHNMKIFRSGVDRLLALDDYQGRYSAFSDSLYL